jgi:hypothetical protein
VREGTSTYFEVAPPCARGISGVGSDSGVVDI